jgi:hypothetical protein
MNRRLFFAAFSGLAASLGLKRKPIPAAKFVRFEGGVFHCNREIGEELATLVSKLRETWPLTWPER